MPPTPTNASSTSSAVEAGPDTGAEESRGERFVPDARPSTRSALAPQRLTIDATLLERVNRGLEDIRAGRMVILVDDEDRENEGDLVMAAEKVTPEAINFMAKHARGLICLTLAEEQVDKLELPMMTAPGRGGPPLGTAFTVSIEARHGVTTGISAADRSHTIRVAASPDAKASDLVTPGHIFPLRARRGGVLVRTGQTEGSVDLARLAHMNPAGVICEIMNDDGTMARMPDLERFAREHDLLILTIADLIQYRMQTERLVRRLAETPIRLDVTGTEWQAIAFEILGEPRQFIALVKGTIDPDEPVLTRVHSGSLIGDVFSSTPSEGGANLRQAIERIEAEGRGVVLYLPPRGEPAAELNALVERAQGKPRPASSRESILREFGLGAQVLADLGATDLRLLTNSQSKIAGIAGFGLRVVERVPLQPQR
jgi:3,4-dihydroxy 2-butanone 4-phosphate synthase / GTP cyclohydrolase II